MMWTQLCGMSFFNKKTIVVDTENNKLYKSVTVDTIEKAFEKDRKKAKEKYDDGYYLLSGTVKEISKSGDGIILKGAGNREIECSCEKAIREDVLKKRKGNEVALFGRISLGTFDKERHLKAVKIKNSPTNNTSDEMYYDLAGNSFDLINTTNKTIGGERVKYRIPKKWEAIEVGIKDKELGTIDGYQYVLSNKPNMQEYFFVAYFDKGKLSDPDDIKRPEAVEKAIIENIEGDVNKFPTKKQKTYYGSQYKYYKGDYTRSAWGDGYRTEYIFQEDGENGIVVMLYVYEESNNLSDVLFVTRFLDVVE